MVGTLLLAWHLRIRPVRHPPGVLIEEVPLQEDLHHEGEPFEHLGFRIFPQARFEARARVLRREIYRTDPVAKLSPVDLALGWGPMSDQAVLDELKITQRGRFYYYRYRLPPPIPHAEIASSSANMHMLPSTPEIERALRSVRSGQLISFAGYLVNVNHAGGTWRSSLTRSDTGKGACEIVWIERFSVE